MKTIKQLAEENKTYKQKIFRIIKSHNIVVEHVSGTVMIDVSAEKAIIKALRKNATKHNSETFSSQTGTVTPKEKEIFKDLKYKIAILEKQLQSKDEQINQLHTLLNQEQQLNLKTLQENQNLRLELKEKESVINKKWWKFWET